MSQDTFIICSSQKTGDNISTKNTYAFQHIYKFILYNGRIGNVRNTGHVIQVSKEYLGRVENSVVIDSSIFDAIRDKYYPMCICYYGCTGHCAKPHYTIEHLFKTLADYKPGDVSHTQVVIENDCVVLVNGKDAIYTIEL